MSTAGKTTIKKPIYKRWWFIALAVLVVLVILSQAFGGGDEGAPESAGTPTSAATTGEGTTSAAATTTAAPTTTEQATTEAPPGFAAVGEPVALEDGGTMTVNGARRIPDSETGFGDSPTNGSFLVVDVTLVAGSDALNVNPLYFRVQGEDGNTYDAALGALESQIISGEVAPGRQVRGEVAFDAPMEPLLFDYVGVLGDVLATVQLA